MFSIGVVAHTARVTQAKALARTVKADFVSMDNGCMGCDDNHRAVQHHLAHLDSTWSVILEDDAVPVEGFRDQLNEALIMAPSPVVSLYLGRKRPTHWVRRVSSAVDRAEQADAHWIIGTHLLHAVGYALRTEVLHELLDFDSALPSDQHISFFCQNHGYTVSYTYPSLVDHADVPTLVEHPDRQPRPAGRVAYRTGTRDHWTTKAVTLQ